MSEKGSNPPSPAGTVRPPPPNPPPRSGAHSADASVLTAEILLEILKTLRRIEGLLE